LSLMRVFVFRLCTKFEAAFPLGRYDALLVSALVGLTLTLKLVRIIAPVVGNLPTKFGVSIGRFVLDLSANSPTPARRVT